MFVDVSDQADFLLTNVKLIIDNLKAENNYFKNQVENLKKENKNLANIDELLQRKDAQSVSLNYMWFLTFGNKWVNLL